MNPPVVTQLDVSKHRFQFSPIRSPAITEVPDQYLASPAKPKSNDYKWIVDVAGIGGAIAGGFLFGTAGVILGGALLATGAVPLRRAWAVMENPQALVDDLSAEREMAVTAGSSLLFGSLFMGASALSRVAGSTLGKFFGKKAAEAMAQNGLAKKMAEKVWTPFKKWYVEGGHLPLRGLAAAPALYDFKDGSLDTGLGFAAAVYSGNLVYSRVFGTNIFGLDTAAPLSFAAYQLFRVLAGADPFDFRDFNYNEMFRFRYIAEFGNILQSTATYGRAYLRPDLRASIAESRGLTASTATGTQKVSPFGYVVDKTLGVLWRRLIPNGVKKIIRPTVAYPVGPLVPASSGSGQWRQALAERTTIIKSFKGNDMMKPVYGDYGGRLLSLAQTWSLVVPWWMLGAPAVGMSRGEWGPNRYWKFTAWSWMGTPIKSGFGGDTVAGQAGGFAIGMLMDAAITQFYNPRYKKKHWEPDLRASLVAYTQAKDEATKQKIARHIREDIYLRQMRDWSFSELLQGNGLHKFNDNYLATWREVVASYPLEFQEILKEIV